MKQNQLPKPERRECLECNRKTKDLIQHYRRWHPVRYQEILEKFLASQEKA